MKKGIGFKVITIFPEIIGAYVSESILGKACQKGLIEVGAIDVRDYSSDLKHHKVDDSPFGGGPGMVMSFPPIARAVRVATEGKKKMVMGKKGQELALPKYNKTKTRVILFSTRGKKLDTKMAKRLSKYENIVMIAGRYEGVDERVAKYLADEEVSIGDYVLTGGELPALVLMDTVARQIPGVLGRYESLEEKKGSYTVYTRPEMIEIKDRVKNKIKKLSVPKVLLSGNHQKIENWRQGKD